MLSILAAGVVAICAISIYKSVANSQYLCLLVIVIPAFVLASIRRGSYHPDENNRTNNEPYNTECTEPHHTPPTMLTGWIKWSSVFANFAVRRWNVAISNAPPKSPLTQRVQDEKHEAQKSVQRQRYDVNGARYKSEPGDKLQRYHENITVHNGTPSMIAWATQASSTATNANTRNRHAV